MLLMYVAGIIIEPVPGNAGLYLPKPGFLEFLREITSTNDALLIFDEVMTGFRLAKGGAQERFGIRLHSREIDALRSVADWAGIIGKRRDAAA